MTLTKKQRLTLVLYIHGRGGSAAEGEHYKPLFPDCEVIGVDYRLVTPWEAGPEINAIVSRLSSSYKDIILIANSIGAFFSIHAGIDSLVRKAFFISPIVDMEQLIGIELDVEWLSFIRSHPIKWDVPTHILTVAETICYLSKPFAHLPKNTVPHLRSWRMESIGSIQKSRCYSWMIGYGSIAILTLL